MDSSEFRCARYWRYPDLTGQRRSEGGTRLVSTSAQKPFFSIITVVRNMKDSLEATICSVLEQTYQNFEYIIIDGLSDDGSLEIIQKYRERISYYISEPDDYLYHAMEKGIELAQGSYINLLNADDCFASPDVLAHVADVLQQNPVDYLLGASYLHDGHEISNIKYPKNFSEIHWAGHEAMHQAYFTRANIYNALGRFPYQKYREVADLQHSLNLIKLGCSKILTDQILIKALNTGLSCINPKKIRDLHIQFFQNTFPKNLASTTGQFMDVMHGSFRHEQIHKMEALAKELSLTDWQCNAMRQELEWRTGKRYRRAECFPDLISVILLCEHTDGKAIQNSLIELETQTYQNLEYIILADSDEDLTNSGSTKILQGKIDAAQIQQATEMAQGEYVFICHIADSWDKAVVDQLYSELKLRSADFAAAYTEFLQVGNVLQTEPFLDYVFQEKASIQDVKLNTTQRFRHFPSIHGKLYHKEFLLGQPSKDSIPSLVIQLLLSAQKSLILSRTWYRVSVASFYTDDPIKTMLEDAKLPVGEIKIYDVFDKLVYLRERQNYYIEQDHQQLQQNQLQLQQDRWYRFGQLSRKRKLWVIAKALSKRLKLYSLLRPLAKVLKRILEKKT